jgi:aspartate racemase
LKAGAAYVPIDPSYPLARVQNMIRDSEARTVVTCETLREALFAELRQSVCFDRDGADLATQAMARPNVEVDPFDLAYVIYTSGSTGKPKGVEIPHRGLVNHSFAIAKNYGLGPGDRVLCSASISFDVAGEQIYPALFSGAEVVVRPDDLFDSFARFDAFVREEAITTMVLPTAFWHEWVRDLGTSGRSVPPSLRALSVGTEKALGEHLGEWDRLTEGRVKFFQGYGPTETSVTCTMYAHDRSAFDGDRPLPIGRPLPNTEIYVLDGRREPVPIGFVGELFVGGHGLARGYHLSPELTAERFVSHPFRSGERLYRTGDLGRYEPDGQIVYAGRADYQVKVRGFRVELGEIEDVLREFPGVDEVVVILREERGQKRLVAYVVATGDVEFAKLKAFAADRLPDYMVPSSVVRLTALPMTANQKVDRSALPPPARSDDEPTIERPTTELERTLAEEWGRLLGVQEIGVRDDFYTLGGDSLLAVRMLSGLEAKLGRAVPLSAFGRGPTIEKLAAFLSSTSSRRAEPLVVVVQEGDGRAPLWLLHPVGGHVVFGRWLRRHMDPRQPILGIQACGLDGEHPPLSTVEAMAELYVGLVRERQPRGPYFLAGPSMGGFLALEIAQRLKQQGEEVALLAFLDTWGPNYPRRTSSLVYFFDQLNTLRTLPTWDERIRRLHERFGPRQEDGAARRSVVPPRYEVLEGIEHNSALVEAIDRVTRANGEANVAYRPRAYDGAIVLLRAEKTTRWSGMRFDDPDNGWRPLALRGLRTISVACTHLELVDEPPPEAGRALQEEIDRVCTESTAVHRHDLTASSGPASRPTRLLIESSNHVEVH